MGHHYEGNRLKRTALNSPPYFISDWYYTG